jgi:hypothetical protein
MTDSEIAALGPAFAAYLRRFRGCSRQARTAKHFDAYGRGLLSDLPRKPVEPIALAAGTAVRTPRSSWPPPSGTTTGPAPPPTGTSPRCSRPRPPTGSGPSG